MQNYKEYLKAIGEPTEGLDKLLSNRKEKAKVVNRFIQEKMKVLEEYNSLSPIKDKIQRENAKEKYDNLKYAIIAMFEEGINYMCLDCKNENCQGIVNQVYNGCDKRM